VSWHQDKQKPILCIELSGQDKNFKLIPSDKFQPKNLVVLFRIPQSLELELATMDTLIDCPCHIDTTQQFNAKKLFSLGIKMTSKTILEVTDEIFPQAFPNFLSFSLVRYNPKGNCSKKG